MSENAFTVIPLPLSVVESNIWDVSSWHLFLGDVDFAERTSHERYVFGVRQGRRVYEVPVAVRWHARDHRVTWRQLTGPVWRGEIRLSAVNGRRTRVDLEVAVHPRSFVGALAEMVGGRPREAEADLVRLADRLASIPQPFNPGRLNPSRRIGSRAEVPAPVRRPAPVSGPAPVRGPETVRSAAALRHAATMDGSGLDGTPGLIAEPVAVRLS